MFLNFRIFQNEFIRNILLYNRSATKTFHPNKSIWFLLQLKCIFFVLLFFICTGQDVLANEIKKSSQLNHCRDNTIQQPTIHGKILDKKGLPISDATVITYEVNRACFDGPLVKIIDKTKSTSNGLFSVKGTSSLGQKGGIVAWKEGLASDWDNPSVTIQKSNYLELTLGDTSNLSGIILNETGRPINNATIFLRLKKVQPGGSKYLSGFPPLSCFVAHTNQNGQFTFTNLPNNCFVGFVVKAKDYGTIYTFDKRTLWPYVAGQENIELTLIPGTTIKGKVVDRITREPIGGILLRARACPGPAIDQSIVKSNKTGEFLIDDLSPGRKYIELVSHDSELSDWVARQIIVETNSNSITEDVLVEVTKGGIIELSLTDNYQNLLANVMVILKEKNTGQSYGCKTNLLGSAQVRVLPGSYKLVRAIKDGYSLSWADNNIIILANETKKMNVKMKRAHQITGVSKDCFDKPVVGAYVSIFPWGSRIDRTDQNGCFNLLSEQDSFSSTQPAKSFIIARHISNNLAGLTEITTFSNHYEIILSPAAILIGTVVDSNDKPIKNAKAKIRLCTNVTSSALTPFEILTDSNGLFRIPALPLQYRYIITLQDGQGKMNEQIVWLTKADIGEVNLGKLSLNQAVFKEDLLPVCNSNGSLACKKIISNQPLSSDEDIAKILKETMVSPQFDNIKFRDIIQYFRDQTGLIIAVRCDVNLDTLISICKNNISAEESLITVLKSIKIKPALNYQIENGKIFISP